MQQDTVYARQNWKRNKCHKKHVLKIFVRPSEKQSWFTNEKNESLKQKLINDVCFINTPDCLLFLLNKTQNFWFFSRWSLWVHRIPEVQQHEVFITLKNIVIAKLAVESVFLFLPALGCNANWALFTLKITCLTRSKVGWNVKLQNRIHKNCLLSSKYYVLGFKSPCLVNSWLLDGKCLSGIKKQRVFHWSLIEWVVATNRRLTTVC